MVPLLLLFSGINAQGFTYGAQPDTFYFRFIFSEQAEQPYQGYCTHGSLRLDNDVEGPVYPLFSEYLTEPFKPHGVARVTSPENGASALEITLEQTKDGQRIYKQLEAIVALPVRVPTNTFKGVLYEVARHDIYLYDLFRGEPFYTLQNVIEENSQELEIEVLGAMLEEAQLIATEMKKQGMESPPVKSGRFLGMDLFEAMQKSEISDIRSFLIYIKLRPRMYQGINWPFAEVYATWIDAGAPSSNEDVIDLLKEHVDDFDSFRKYLNSYAKRDYATLTRELLQQAISFRKNEKDLKSAMVAAKVSLKVAEAAESMENIGWAHYEIAEIYSEKNASEKAIQSYKKAVEYFELSTQKMGLLAAYNNLGRALNKKATEQDFNEAIVQLNKAIALKGAVSGSEDGHATIAQLYRNLGDSYVGLEKYKKAVETYDVGLTYTIAENALSLKRRSLLYMQLAIAYKNQDKESEAEEYNRKGVMTYKRYEELMEKEAKM